MDSFIKRGYIEFRTLAPVYVGCGRTAGKKEYLVDAKAGTVEVLQMHRVYDRISRLGLEERFEQYLLAPADQRGRGTPGRELIDFVRDNRIPESEYRTWSKEIVRWADRDMSFRSVKDIQLFARNEKGDPYIPGSGFKGMLRTVLETDYYLRDHQAAAEVAGRIRRGIQAAGTRPVRRERFLKDEDAAIDVASMHRELFDPQSDRESRDRNLRDQKNDVLRGLLVGDSEPLSWDDMCICQKIDLNTAGEEKPLNVLREAIRPGVTIRIPISIDTRICPYTTRDILDAIASFYLNYHTQFTGKRCFSNVPPTNGNKTTFYLGGGTGYVSKTVTYGILRGSEGVRAASSMIQATLNDRARREHGHARDVEKGVSPHVVKCTRYGGKLYQMGTCCVVKYL